MIALHAQVTPRGICNRPPAQGVLSDAGQLFHLVEFPGGGERMSPCAGRRPSTLRAALYRRAQLRSIDEATISRRARVRPELICLVNYWHRSILQHSSIAEWANCLTMYILLCLDACALTAQHQNSVIPTPVPGACLVPRADLLRLLTLVLSAMPSGAPCDIRTA